MKSLLHGGFTITFMHLVLQMAAFALLQRLILTIMIESFSIDQGGGVMLVFRSEKTLCKSSGQRKRRKSVWKYSNSASSLLQTRLDR